MEREILVRELKTWPEFFKDLANGTKTFEVRRDDRDFQPGDILLLREWDPVTEKHSGREVRRRITYRTPKGSPLAREGFVVFGIKDVASHGSCWPDARPRYQLTDPDWQRLRSASRPPTHPGCDRCSELDTTLAREINSTIFLAEESLRKAIASDLRSVGSSHPELAAWAETLACRYDRGEEAA